MPALRPRTTNGHRWRQLKKRVRDEETHCALCGEWVDQTTPTPQPGAPEVDHDIPIHRGGDEYDRNNCRLMHRACNRWKSTMTLDEARAKRAGITPAPLTTTTLTDW